jgi:hypothetical protein
VPQFPIGPHRVTGEGKDRVQPRSLLLEGVCLTDVDRLHRREYELDDVVADAVLALALAECLL